MVLLENLGTGPVVVVPQIVACGREGIVAVFHLQGAQVCLRVEFERLVC